MGNLAKAFMLFFLLFAGFAFADGTNGTISGFVRVSNGTGVPNSNVSTGPNWSINTTSNGTGWYSFANLSYLTNGSSYLVRAQNPFNPALFTPILNITLNDTITNASQNLTFNESGGPPDNNNCTNASRNFSVSGYLLSNNAPISGQLFVSVWSNQGMGGGGTQSNATGFYNKSCLESGNYTIGSGGGGGNGTPNFQWTQVNITISNDSISVNISLSQMQSGPQGCNGNGSIYGYVFSNNSGNLTGIASVNIYAGSGGSGGMGGGPGGGGGSFCGGGTSTNGSGFYNITGLMAGTYMLNVMPPYGSGYGEVHLPPEQSISIASNTSTAERNFTLARTGSFSGRVLGNNSGTLVPVEYAYVNLFEQRPGGAWAGGSTNGTGHFNFSVPAGTNFALNVNPPYGSGYATFQLGMGGPEQQQSGINITSGSDYNYGNITLRMGARIQGYVLAPNGSGLRWANVNAHPKMMMGPSGGGQWGFANTQEDGSYQIAGLQDNSTYIVEVQPNWDSDYSSASQEVYLSSSVAYVNFSLSSGNRLQGYVKCQGVPLQYSNINLFRSDGGMGGMNGPMMGPMEAGSFAFAMSDGTGFYSARGLRAGTFNIRVEMPWGSSSNCSSYTSSLNVSNGTTNLNITMPTAATITGFVKNAAGAPIPYAPIDAFVPSQGGPGGPMMESSTFAMADSSGNYTMRISPNSNEYIVAVHPPWGSNYAGAEVRLNITNSSQTYYRNFTLSTGGSIRGRVVKPDGTSVQFAFVNAFSERARSFGFAGTASDGMFEVRGLTAANDYRLFVQPPTTTGGILPTFLSGITVLDGNTTELGTINASSAESSMLVTITNGGSAVQSANVNAWLPFTPYFGQCTTNSTGQCNITGLSDGDYDVFINTANRPPTFRTQTVSGQTNFTFDYSVSLGSLYTLDGYVVNSTGGGVANAEVGIWNESSRFGMHTMANSTGYYSISGIAAGGYKLGSRAPGYFDSMSTVQVSANSTQNITLPKFNGTSYTVNGYLTSISSSSVATKSVVIFDAINASMFSIFNVTNNTGYYTISGVPDAPTTFTISAILGNDTYSYNRTITSNITVNITVA